uniref:Vint domain-containing protein n=1 Tax=viral metagenome TaxID=1070528 RepID=A0A6C0BQ76_9ZZZZ
MTSTYDSIKKLYGSQTYLDKYIVDVIITIFICCIVIYFVFKNKINDTLNNIDSDWENNRCKPEYIPISGFVKSSEGNTIYEKSVNNFNYCISELYKKDFNISLSPLTSAINSSLSVMVNISDALTTLLENTKKIKLGTISVFKNIITKMNELVIQLTQQSISMKSVIAMIHATIVTAVYSIIGSYYTGVSVFIMFSEAFFNFIMVVLILTAIILMVTPVTFAVGMGIFLQGVALFAVLILLNNFIKNAFGIHIVNMKLPKMPGKGKKGKKCFAHNTNVSMMGGEYKQISDLVIGDVLLDGSIVTSIQISVNDELSFVNINGVIVTNDHKIYYHNWIDAKYHPEAKVVQCNDPYVYCIGTSSKIITLNGCIFSDWDEITIDDLSELTNVDICTGRTPNIIKLKDVHMYFDTGYHGDTLVTLKNGNIVPIQDVKNGDVLGDDSVVTTTVSIMSKDLDYFSYYKDGVHLFDSTGNIVVDDIDIQFRKTQSPEKSYNLVTNTGNMNIYNINVGDYNKGIEKFFPESRWY